MTAPKLADALATAHVVHDRAVLEQAIERMAEEIRSEYADGEVPLYITVMNGGMPFASQLAFALGERGLDLEFDYLHATRYRSGTRGGEIDWIARPRPAVAGQVVLVVDDIFDEGDTLHAILGEIRQQGATAVYSAVLVDKRHDRKVSGLTVDFVGLEVPDRYVFGCGMDYKEYWRNLPAIYAARE